MTVTLEFFSDVMNQGLLHAANIKCHIKLMFFTSFSGSHYVPDGDKFSSWSVYFTVCE